MIRVGHKYHDLLLVRENSMRNIIYLVGLVVVVLVVLRLAGIM